MVDIGELEQRYGHPHGPRNTNDIPFTEKDNFGVGEVQSRYGGSSWSLSYLIYYLSKDIKQLNERVSQLENPVIPIQDGVRYSASTMISGTPAIPYIPEISLSIKVIDSRTVEITLPGNYSIGLPNDTFIITAYPGKMIEIQTKSGNLIHAQGVDGVMGHTLGTNQAIQLMPTRMGTKNT